ncbi:hypothetical protein GS528_16695 [Rhodococcus hoagii]|nr:hypothetical protein [Prescottella equi]
MTEVFAKGAAPRVLTEILPDGSEEQTTYITLTVGVDIAAPAEVIEQAFSTLSLPESPQAPGDSRRTDMVTEAARGPLANNPGRRSDGQGLMLAGSLLARAVADLPAHQLDGVSFGTFYGVLGIGAGLSWWYSQRLKRGSRQPLRSTAAVAVEPGTVADATAAPSTATEVRCRRTRSSPGYSR